VSAKNIAIKGDPLLLTQHLQSKDDGFVICVVAKPQAKHEEFCITVDQVSIKVNAPAQEGKANERLQKILATIFGLAKSKVVILKGQQGRLKMYYLIEKDRAVLLDNLRRSIG
jgi:uncharacterized protein (TIGR00251 family)